jgi:hypothetical protein
LIKKEPNAKCPTKRGHLVSLMPRASHTSDPHGSVRDIGQVDVEHPGHLHEG